MSIYQLHQREEAASARELLLCLLTNPMALALVVRRALRDAKPGPVSVNKKGKKGFENENVPRAVPAETSGGCPMPMPMPKRFFLGAPFKR